jgi:demethylmenaquinone methyltransferase/2-methoxy-6-polyprenyl-1,4-benzoquinol methylase
VRLDTPATGARNSRFARRLFTGLPERYDRLAELLSLGQNGRWRTAMVDHIVPGHPQRILDVASGPAGVALQLASRTGAHVVGVDLTEAMIRQGHENVARAGVEKQVQVVLGKGEQLPFPDATFDALTFTYLLRYVEDVPATLRELARVVRPGGVVAMQEFGLPRGVWRPLWELYVRIGLPGAGAIIAPGWHEVGSFLGPSIRNFWKAWPEQKLLKAWHDAGIGDVRGRRLSVGGGVVVWGTKR